MKKLAVFFILVICVQNVVPDEVLDFKELFRNGYIGSLTGPSNAQTRHFGGRWGGGRGGHRPGRRPGRRRWRPRPRPRPRPETDTDTETEDEEIWYPPWWWPRPWTATTRTTTPTTTTTTTLPPCDVTTCRYYKARCDIETDTLRGTFLLVEPKFGQSDEQVMTQINYGLEGIFPPNTEHGIHIHQYGDEGAKCADVGEHYNPEKINHAAPTDRKRHAGDMGNLNVTEDGSARGTLFNLKVKLYRNEFLGSVIGRSIVLKIGKDDLGKGGSPLSLSTGNAGPPIGCCLILPVYIHGEEEWYSGNNDPFSIET